MAQARLDAARFYHEKQRWFCRLILTMPDHLHAIPAFRTGSEMSATVKRWKSSLHRAHAVMWQDGHFDHRLRNRKERNECWGHIPQNPGRAGLVAQDHEWPWMWWPNDVAVPQ